MKSLTTALLTSLFIQSLASAQEQGSKEFYFLENKGQWPEEVLFHTSLAGQAVWITDHGITYDYYRIVPDSMEVATEEDWYYDEYDHRTYSRTGQVVVQHWEGSSPPDHKEANKRLLAYNNYFIGRDSSKWTSRVGRFAEVLLHNIYPYIDVRYYFQAQHLRYDFILHPGADPDDIRMKFEGAELIDFTNERFSLSTLMGDVTHDDLQAWQPFPENQQQVSASFRWLKPSTIGFHVHWTDRKRDLIIDPIIWATYLGGANSDEIFDMDLDAENNVFITGKTHGFYYPITPGAYFQETTQSQFHIFLSKISMDGTELLFSSIFGEDNIIHFTRMAVDPSGCPIVGSFTNNDNYPITEGAFQSELLSENITLSKLSSDGTELLFSTFFGGSWGTEIGDIAVDEENNIYFTGKSRYSDDYPLTVEPEENLMPSSTNVIFVKMNASGSELICSNMLGGSENEGGHVIAIRPDHHILIGGITRSPDFPVSENAIQSELLEEYVNDGFVIELDSSGAEIIYSTLIGSTGDSYWNDRIRALLWCENGDYLLVGCTAAEDFPTTSNAQDSTYNGGYGNVVNLDGDVFITRISPESNQPVYSSYWGGSAHDLVFDAAFDSQERLIVVGRTSSFDLEVTQNVIDSTLSEGDLFLLDVFILRFKSDLLSFDYCTYLGGSNAEQPGGGVKIDGADDAYVSIWSSSGELYTSPNAYQPEFAEQDWFSNVDCYIFKMNFCPSASIQFNAPLCEGDTLMLNGAGGDAYSWTGPDGFAAFGSSQVLQNVQVSQSGVYTLTASTSQAQGADKDCSDTVSVTVDIYEMPEAVIESNNPVCEGDTLIVMSSGPYQMHWTGPEGLDSLTSSISFPDAASSMSGYYYLNVSYPTVGSIECADSTSLWVTVNPLPEVMLTLGDTICQNTPAFALSGGLPSGGTYSGAGISSGYFIAANAGVGLHEITYSYTDENGCSQSASSTLEVVTCIEVPEQMNESIWQIYPNPFENELHIISDIHPFMIRLFNSIGQEVFVQSNPVTHIRADLTALSSGVYLLELESKNGQRGVYVLEKY